MGRWAVLSAAAGAVAALLLALWMWEHAAWLVLRWGVSHQQAGAWAVRSAAVGIIAVSQFVLVACVADWFYRSDRFSRMLKLSAALVLAVSVLCALALGVAGISRP